jgi:hypothetical protein
MTKYSIKTNSYNDANRMITESRDRGVARNAGKDVTRQATNANIKA